MKVITYKSWNVCSTCGFKKYPKADKNKMIAITVSKGTCVECGKKNVTLIPWSDFEYASGDESKWD